VNASLLAIFRLRIGSRVLSLFGSLVILLAALPGLAQTNFSALNNRLQQAVARQSWAEAIHLVDQMIVAAPDQSSQLRTYRDQLVRLKTHGVGTPTSSVSVTGGNQSTSSPLGATTIKRRDHGIPVVEVRMNSRVRFEMMVDSGASMTVITRPMAAALGITPAQIVDEAHFSTANGTTTMPIVYVKSIEVAGLSTKMVPVAVAGPEMEIGLLGQDFLQQFDVSIRKDAIEFHQRR
jgi:aspartyl protease family protein